MSDVYRDMARDAGYDPDSDEGRQMAAAIEEQHRKELEDNERKYPCADCGTMRSKNEGGTTFTVCDECWEKRYGADDDH